MDDLRKKSDKELEKMEKKIVKIYKDAEKDIAKSWNEYMKKAENRIAKYEEKYEQAKKSGDQDLIAKTGKTLGIEKHKVTLQDTRYKEMLAQTTEKLTHTNEIAMAYVNGQMPKIYTLNYNGTLQEIQSEVGKVGDIGFSFSLVDERTVRNLVKSDTSLFPQKTIDRAKDEKWNLKAINSQVLQGILQGESIPKIADRLQNVTDMNSKAAVRNARTMCTAAENNGRLSGMKEAEEQGIVYEKQWMATHDDRTRVSHAEIDGVSVGLDEEFPNGLQYPGDPMGYPEDFYNCRCSMVRELIGFRRADGSISPVEGIVDYEPDYFEKAKESKLPEEFKKDWRSTKADYSPFETIEDAEKFAKDTFVDGGFSLTGKDVTYKGLSIDVVNEVNSTLNDIYSKFNIPKLSSLEAYGKKDKRAYSKNSDAPFFTTNLGNVGINNTIIPTEKAVQKYIDKGKESFEFVMANMGSLSGTQRELAEKYQKAGRSLVDESLSGMLAHEIGHHLSYDVEINKSLSYIQKGDEWKTYAESLSGYANHSFGEYVAESFSAYYKGEEELLQPEMIKIFEGLRK